MTREEKLNNKEAKSNVTIQERSIRSRTIETNVQKEWNIQEQTVLSVVGERIKVAEGIYLPVFQQINRQCIINLKFQNCHINITCTM